MNYIPFIKQLKIFGNKPNGPAVLDANGDLVANIIPSTSALSDISAAASTVKNMPTWSLSLLRAQARQAAARIVVYGDSITAGMGADYPEAGGTNKAVGGSFVALLGHMLNERVKTGLDAKISPQGTAGNNAAYDSRVVLGTGWTNATVLFQSTAGPTSGTLDFTFESDIDTFEVLYSKFVGAASAITISVDGSSTGYPTINSDAAYPAGLSTTGAITISSGVGRHKVSLNNTSVGSIAYINGVIGYDSKNPGVQIVQIGYPGTTAAQSNAFSGFGSKGDNLTGVSPALSIIVLGTNDITNFVSASDYLAAITNIVTKAKLTGDAIVVYGIPSNVAHASWAGSTQDEKFTTAMEAYKAVMVPYCATNNINLIDMRNCLGANYTEALANGYFTSAYSSGVHPNTAGHYRMAEYLAPPLI